MALISLESYSSIPNVNDTNNTFAFGDVSSAKTTTIPTGSYELADIDVEIQRQMKTNGDWEHAAHMSFIKLRVNQYLLKCVVDI